MGTLIKWALAPILILAASMASGEIPDTLGFQGRLNRPGEGPVDGVFSMTINIYNTNSGGLPLFTEFHPDVVVTKGRFNIELGSVDPVNNALSDSLDFKEKYFLGITVAGDSEMTPRLPFNSVAYAQRAAAAARADEAQESSTSDTAEFASKIRRSSFRLRTEHLLNHTIGPGSVISVYADCGAFNSSPGDNWLVTGGGYSITQISNGPSNAVDAAVNKPTTGFIPGGSTAVNRWLVRFANRTGLLVGLTGTVEAICVRASAP